jgi:solute:Na+ symporter, SSS family
MATTLDLVLLGSYLLVTVVATCGFAGQARTAESFMAAGRSLPGWVVGLSLFGSFVSSITFLANPGKAYGGNWSAWVFALTLPFAAAIATRWFVPFFRHSGEVSAYHHLEQRFGPWARTYGVVCYIVTQLFRLATILYLLSLALSQVLPVSLPWLIVMSGVIVTICPLFGGTAGVMWVGVAQSLVLMLGTLICVVQLWWQIPGGVSHVLTTGWTAEKLSLGTPTLFCVTFVYGLAINLQNFGIDQSYVQRYITARNDSAAQRSVWFGAITYIPVSAAFLLIGTALWVYYQTFPGRLPAGMADDAVFPYFLRAELPSGLRGLVLAAVCSAALDSNLNCCATLYLADIHRRYVRPQCGDREAVRVLRLTTLILGILSTWLSMAMIDVKSALDAWWNWAGIAGGGILGLFLLGRLCPRADGTVGLIATGSGVLTILSLTLGDLLPASMGWPKSPCHPLLTGVFGTLTILGVGAVLSAFRPRQIGAGDVLE